MSEILGDVPCTCELVESLDTDVKVFEGAVEEMAVAESGGVGVRVVVDGRMGYAWVGSLAPDLVAGVLDEARDNARFAAPDEWNDLPLTRQAAIVTAVLDHVIVGRASADPTGRGHFSFRAAGLL